MRDGQKIGFNDLSIFLKIASIGAFIQGIISLISIVILFLTLISAFFV